MGMDFANAPRPDGHGLVSGVLHSGLSLDVFHELGDPLTPDLLGQVGPTGNRGEMKLELLAMGSIAGSGTLAKLGRPLAGPSDPATNQGFPFD